MVTQTSDSKSRCIYCLEEKPDAYFNKEHVLPEILGKFQNAPILSDLQVCEGCNKFFGKHLDWELAKDSYIAITAIRCGLHEPPKGIPFRKRVKIEIEEGPYQGAIVELYRNPKNELCQYFIPQIGFPFKDRNRYKFFSIPQLKSEEYLKNTDLNLTGVLKCYYSTSPKEKTLIEKMLVKLGKKIEKIKVEPNPEGRVEILLSQNSTVDNTILRSFFKVGFNYLTYKAGVSFVLHSCFDPVRQFIRFGETDNFNPNEFSRPHTDSIFADEGGKYRSKCHALAVEWHKRRLVVGHVTFFHDLTWELILTRDYPAIWREIKGGHVYDLKTMIAREIPLINRNLVLPKYRK